MPAEAGETDQGDPQFYRAEGRPDRLLARGGIGWDTVLKEAKDAKIPVILTDRAVDSKDKSLYKTFIGSDFVLEGKKPEMAGQ